MPEAKIKHILSFSSEEPPHKADNLLNNDASRKWKCAAGENQASVVFQLDKSTELSSIDIGNEGSAFVEVLVGRSSNDNVQYRVILVASSFMSPQESRQGTSPNRVRIFDKDKLAPDVVSQKWDVVKVVCTQPFNKRISYGLSFVKLHTLSGDIKDIKTEAETLSSTKVKEEKRSFGGFKLKEEKKADSGDFNPGSQMMMYQMEKRGDGDTSPNEIRSSTDKTRALPKQEEQKKESKRRSRSPVAKKIEEKKRKIDKSSHLASSTPAKSSPVKFDKLKQKKPSNTQTTSTPTESASRVTAKPVNKKEKIKRSYDQILSGVIFILSGFQNPLRSELREKALRMGAQYRKDWTPGSTHLVCAFPNTPKYRQVIGCGGKIVRKEWIEDCASRKQLISWKKYSMDPDESSESSSEEEEEIVRISRKEEKSPDPIEQEDDPYGGSTDGGGDTEDEIEKIQVHKSKSGDPTANDTDDDDGIYNASTDEEVKPDENGGDKLPPLPDYFNNSQFLLYGDFSSDVRRLLKRHIIACGGKISEYMNDDIEYVVTKQVWDDNFDQALSSNAGLVFLKPNWIFQCGHQQKLVPYQPYVVSHS